MRRTSEDYIVPDVVDDEEAASNAYLDICEDAVERARTRASKIEIGAPGYCDFCGNHFTRVVDRVTRTGETVQACGKCRDENRLG